MNQSDNKKSSNAKKNNIDTTKSKKKSTPKTQLPRNKAEWIELCAWIELNLFEYNGKQHLQTNACYILDGLRKGQCVANTNQEMHGEYPLQVVLMAFKINKIKILNAIKNKDFKSETSKMSYICSIVRDSLNDVYTRYINIEKSKEKVETINTDIINYQGAEYKPTVKDNKNEEKWKGLW